MVYTNFEDDQFDFQPGKFLKNQTPSPNSERANFLAKHLKNTVKLKECLDQGYNKKAG